MTNREIQKQVTGMIQKTAWSMLWQNKEVTIMDIAGKGYKESSVRASLNKFVKEGWAVKPERTRNTYRISESVTNG